jgi:hypothetical protein
MPGLFICGLGQKPSRPLLRPSNVKEREKARTFLSAAQYPEPFYSCLSS